MSGLQGAGEELTARIQLVKAGWHQAGDIHRMPKNCVELQGKEGQPGGRARALVRGILYECPILLRFRIKMLRAACAPANAAIIGATTPATLFADWDGEQWRRREPQQDPDDERGDQPTCHIVPASFLPGGAACRCPGCRNWLAPYFFLIQRIRESGRVPIAARNYRSFPFAAGPGLENDQQLGWSLPGLGQAVLWH